MDGERRVIEPIGAPRGAGAALAWAQGGLSRLFARKRPLRSRDLRRQQDFLRRCQFHARAGLALITVFGVATTVSAGGHWPAIRSGLAQTPDVIASMAGFRVRQIVVTGQVELTTEEIVDAVGLDATRSLVFLDAAVARDQLLALPLVETASVRKYYPGRVEIMVEERKPFAVWQHDGEFHVISEDGTSIDVVRDSRFSDLPLVVGAGAEAAAAEFLPILLRYPEVEKQTYGAVLVGERRWNLRLVNGTDVKLPETGVESALVRLAALLEGDILRRDLVSIDVRDRARTIVLLTEAAAKAHAEAAKERTRRSGGAT